MRFLNKVLDFIFPNYCLSCKESGKYICRECLSDLPRADISEHDFITSIFNYRNKTMKNLIWLLKYRGRLEIAGILAEAMYENFLEELNDLKIFNKFIDPILIPIPISTRRLKERGFNQAEVLARKLSTFTEENLEVLNNVLFKPIDTTPQAKIKDRKMRLKNAKGCFGIKNAELIKGRNIIIIDDVSTTGATIIEAKKVLEKSGARHVVALTVAH